MRTLLFYICVLSLLTGYSQTTEHNDFKLTISPSVYQTDETTNHIIETLKKFLKTKNDSYTENRYWLQSDFERYGYPYLDIFGIEHGNKGYYFYQPTLMEIIPTKYQNQWIVKIAFMGYDAKTKENQLRTIYNLIAQKTDKGIIFSKYQNYVLESWKEFQFESLTYKISPLKELNIEEVRQQLKEIQQLTDFFNTEPIPITYISCISPKEVFEVKGFDYNPMMHVDTSGGLAEFGNIILSGNHSEIYTHEIVHIYTMNLFPDKNYFLDEGLATFIAGSGKFDYQWHRNKFKLFLELYPDFKIEDYVEDPYKRLFFEEETSIPYLIGAVICERTLRLYGKERFFEVLNSREDLWFLLKKIGLTKENFNKEIRKELGQRT